MKESIEDKTQGDSCVYGSLDISGSRESSELETVSLLKEETKPLHTVYVDSFSIAHSQAETDDEKLRHLAPSQVQNQTDDVTQVEPSIDSGLSEKRQDDEEEKKQDIDNKNDAGGNAKKGSTKRQILLAPSFFGSKK